MLGGKVIGSGTYGCVFKPPLKCEGDTQRPQNYISKVMETRNANDEDREIKSILNLVKDIPNHEDYYMVSGVTLCKPQLPTISDYKDYNEKCHALLRKEIKSWDFGKALGKGKIMMLQIPDGGASIENLFIEPLTESEFSDINRALIKVMVNGIVPLNNSNTLHMDIKGGNIVYSKRDKKAKLIDWGLAIHFDDPTIAPIQDLEQYSIMVNQPFTRLLFYTDFQRDLNNFSKSHTISSIPNKTYETLLPIYTKFLRDNYFTDEKTKREQVFDRHFDGIGHLDYILGILIRSLGSPKSGLDLIAQQIASAYLRFSFKDGIRNNFDENAFFYQVFRHNCDIHGFLYSYYDATFSNNRLDRIIRKDIMSVLIKYLFSIDYSDKRFPIEEIATRLRAIDKTPSPAPAPMKVKKNVTLKKKTPLPLPLRVESGPSDRALTELLSLEPGRKRCPKGTRRDKKTGKCKRIVAATRANRAASHATKAASPATKAATRANTAASHATKAATRATRPEVFTLSATRKRCPRGYRIDKKTRKCHRIRK